MEIKKIYIISFSLIILIFLSQWVFKNFNFNDNYVIGQKLDSLHSVVVYYNGGVDNVTERNTTSDNYNLGLKYQCVEFVKRYYYEVYNHKMPDAMGNAKDFFDGEIADSNLNTKRNLRQFTNPSKSMPLIGDLIIFKGSIFNRYGHVAIISNVNSDEVEIKQQNPGPYANSREKFNLKNTNNKWFIDNDRVLGWLRKDINQITTN